MIPGVDTIIDSEQENQNNSATKKSGTTKSIEGNHVTSSATTMMFPAANVSPDISTSRSNSSNGTTNSDYSVNDDVRQNLLETTQLYADSNNNSSSRSKFIISEQLDSVNNN